MFQNVSECFTAFHLTCKMHAKKSPARARNMQGLVKTRYDFNTILSGHSLGEAGLSESYQTCLQSPWHPSAITHWNFGPTIAVGR